MAVARVVTFDGVSSERMQQMQQEMDGRDAPEGMPPAEIIVMHDPAGEKSTVVLLFENEDDYEKADKILNEMDAGDTPGQRTSVTKFHVPMRRKV